MLTKATQENLDIRKEQRTGKIRSLFGDIEVLFHYYIAIIVAKNIVRFTQDFVI